MTRLNLEIKIKIIILMAKLESVTLARRTLKQPKFKYMPESKTLWELYERFCQAG